MARPFQPTIASMYAVIGYDVHIRRILDAHWDRIGVERLSLRQSGILYALSLKPRLVGELAQEFYITQQAMGKQLRLLERAGLVEGRKPKQGKGDRRQHPYYITDEGIALVSTIKPGRDAPLK